MSISVGDKYVIEIGAIAELPNGKKKYFIKPFESLVFDRKGLEQLESIKEIEDTEAYKKGYDLAVANAQETKLAWGEHEYNRGLEDLVKAIKWYRTLNYPQRVKYYGAGKPILAVAEDEPYELVKAWKAYEEKKQAEKETVKVGDVIYSKSTDTTAIVTIIDAWGYWHCVEEDGATFTLATSVQDQWNRTGKHYGIESILKELGE